MGVVIAGETAGVTRDVHGLAHAAGGIPGLSQVVVEGLVEGPIALTNTPRARGVSVDESRREVVISRQHLMKVVEKEQARASP